MPLPPADQISGLLHRWGAGDAAALNQLVPLLYEQLRLMAHHRLLRERNSSLNTTAVVHEAYLRLANATHPSVRDRGHFLALSSRVMRNVVVDHARARAAAKRGPGTEAGLEPDLLAAVPDEALAAYSELDAALKRLEQLNPRQARILEQRYFGGLTLEETAQALDASLATIKRELRSARAWLAVQLEAPAPAEDAR